MMQGAENFVQYIIQAKNPCLQHGSTSLRLPPAWTLDLPGAPPPGPLGVTSQQPTYCLSQSVAHCTSYN